MGTDLENSMILASAEAESGLRSRCSESGRLICKDYGYALRRNDGPDIWLEMERIPLDLLERRVTVGGQRFAENFICVDLIEAS